MRIEALGSKLTVERLDERVVRWLAGPREVECDVALISPQVEIARDEPLGLGDATGEPSTLGSDPLSSRLNSPRPGRCAWSHALPVYPSNPRIGEPANTCNTECKTHQSICERWTRAHSGCNFRLSPRASTSDPCRPAAMRKRHCLSPRRAARVMGA
jgi:hypothetical protein